MRALFVGGWSLADGMLVTLKHLFKKPVTQQYPHEMKTLPERTRGTLVLYADTEKMKINCTVCLVCEVVCPNNSLHIDFIRDPEAKSKKMLRTFVWDGDKCIYCGLCVEGCNFDALGWIPEFEQTVLDKDELIWDERDMMDAWFKSEGKDVDVKKIDLKWYD